MAAETVTALVLQQGECGRGYAGAQGRFIVSPDTLFDSGSRAAVDVLILGDVFADSDPVIKTYDGLLRPR